MIRQGKEGRAFQEWKRARWLRQEASRRTFCPLGLCKSQILCLQGAQVWWSYFCPSNSSGAWTLPAAQSKCPPDPSLGIMCAEMRGPVGWGL